jgi:DNA-binding protein HU-beta
LKYKEFIEELAAQNQLSVDDATDLSTSLVSVMADFLVSGGSVSIQGFGVFGVKKHNERVTVNPVTGKKWLIPPKLIPHFRPGPALKEKIKQYG